MRASLCVLVLLSPLCAFAGEKGVKPKPMDPDGDPPLKLKDKLLSPAERAILELRKEIEAVRGLKYTGPVSAKILPLPAGEARRVGFYDINSKTLFLFDDLKGDYDKAALVHELVHALQDQNFELAKMWARLREEKLGEEAQLALAALIQGDATLTTIEVMETEKPKMAAILDTPLEKATNLHDALIQVQGARYLKQLRDGKGGWRNVDRLYVAPPRSTAPFLNMKGVSTVNFGAGVSMGAFGLWKKLHDLEPSRDVALRLAKAWRGDRLLEFPSGKAFIFVMGSPADAKLLADTFTKLLGKGPDIVFDVRHQMVVEGNRVYMLSAVGEKGLTQLRDRVFGPLSLFVYSARAERLISYGDFIEELLGQDIICIGEYHDNELHHRVEFQIIKSLFARDERLGIGLEMFQQPAQKVLDAYLEGRSLKDKDKPLDEAGFLTESKWASWGFDYSMYRPIIEFARKNHIPMAAINAPSELTAKISKGGWESLSDEDKKVLGPVDLHQREHREYWYERLSKLHGDDKAPPDKKERGYQVMATWDDFMGRTAADFQKARGARRMVILAGLGHIEHGFGIPFRAARQLGGRVATVGIMINPADMPSSPSSRILLDDRPMTDYVVLVRD